MKILEVHEVHDWMIELDLSDFDIITFDDGLYTQYKHFHHFRKFNKPMYFFISTDIVLEDELEQIHEVISCRSGHRRYKLFNDKSAYMTWDQIKDINQYDNCFIGGHSDTHPDLENESKINQLKLASYEAIRMFDKFEENGIVIESFCYPYNKYIPGYQAILSKYNICPKQIFGKDRIKIEDLK